MAEIAYIPDPRAADTPPSREFDCDCPGGGSGGFTGTGSPEGVVTADPGAFYADEATNSIWVKETGSGTVGWEQYTA